MIVRLPISRLVAAQMGGGLVVTGRTFDRLTNSQKRAVLAHEEGHATLRHQRERLRYIFTGRWARLPELCRQQELEADAYAVKKGHGTALVNFIHAATLSPTDPPKGGGLHPSPHERIIAILRLLEKDARGQ